jgi:hypothetical protein
MKKPTNWRPLVRHKCSQNTGVLYPLVDEPMAMVDEVMGAVDPLIAISFGK